jgi:hypothetical protein
MNCLMSPWRHLVCPVKKGGHCAAAICIELLGNQSTRDLVPALMPWCFDLKLLYFFFLGLAAPSFAYQTLASTLTFVAFVLCTWLESSEIVVEDLGDCDVVCDGNPRGQSDAGWGQRLWDLAEPKCDKTTTTTAAAAAAAAAAYRK